MNDGDNKRKLYDALSKDYDMGTFEQFSTDVEDDGKRKKLYEAIKGEYDLPDFDGFTRQLVGERSQVQQPVATPDQQGERSPYQMAQGNTPTYDYGEPLGPEKFAKQMQFEQRVRQSVPSPEAMMQDFSQRMDAVLRDGRPLVGDASQPFGGYEDVFAPARRQIETEEAKAQNRVQVSTLKDEVSAALNERGQQLDREAMSSSLGDRPMGGGALVHTFNSSTVNGRYADERWKMLNAANNALANAEKMIREADTKGGVHDWSYAELVRGFEKVGDPRTWDFGLTAGVDATALMGALDKADRGETLTREEQMLLDAKAVEMATKMYYESGASGWYKAGEVTADAIPYMLEFMINPAAKLGRSAQSILTRYALKRFGKEALKTFGKDYLKGNAKRFGGRALADVAGSGVMNLTTGMARVFGGAAERTNGQVRYATDTDGNSVFAGREKQEDPTTAFLKSLGSGWIGQHSELFGAYFAPLLKGAGKLIKGGMLSKAGKAMRLHRVYDAIDKISHSDWAKVVADFEKNTQWHGPIEEWGEEMVDGIENALIVGDQTLDADPETGVFNRENMLETLRSVAVMGGVFAAVKTAGYRTPKHKGKRAMTAADDAALAAFGGDQYTWGGIRNTIAFGSDEDALRRMNQVMTDPKISRKQKKAALDYYKAAYTYKGMLAGDRKRKAGGAVTPEQEAAWQAFNNGYEADEDGRRDIMIEAGMGEPTEARKAAVEGVRQRIEDEAEEMAEQQRMEAAKRQFRDEGAMKGAVRPVTATIDGKDTDVFLTSGAIVLTDDGSMVDQEKTNEVNGIGTIVVYDPQLGRERQIFAGNITAIGAVTSAEQQNQNIEANRQAYIQSETDKAQGKVMARDIIQLAKDQTVQVVEVGPEESKVMLADGTTTTMPTETLQAAKNIDTKNSYHARHQEDEATAEQPTEEATGEQAAVAPGIVEGAPAEFLPDMEITILDDEGNEQPAIVLGRVRIEGRKFVPDENGDTVEYMVDGQVKHDWIKTLKEKMVSPVDATLAAQETAAEQPAPAPTEAPTTETPTETPAPSTKEELRERNEQINNGSITFIEESDDLLDKPEGIYAISKTDKDGFTKIKFRKKTYNTKGELRVQDVGKPGSPYIDASATPEGKAFEEENDCKILSFRVSEVRISPDGIITVEGMARMSDGEEEWTSELTFGCGYENPFGERMGLSDYGKAEAPSHKRYDAKIKEELDKLPVEQRTAEKVKEIITAIDENREPNYNTIAQRLRYYNEHTTAEPHIAMYDSVKAKYPDTYREKVENTVKIKSKRVADLKKELDKANDKLTNTEFGSREEATAEEKRNKAQNNYDAAVADLELWKAVKSAKDQEKLAEAAERAERDRAAHEAAVLAEQQRQAEEIAKREEQARLGANNVAPAIREKWNNAKKVKGFRDRITLPNGTVITGTHMLVEAKTLTPSHDGNNEFKPTDGFPVDENGQNINTRDYYGNKQAQESTLKMAENFDERGQGIVVNGDSGIALSGNGRTIAAQIAARKGTDGKYQDYLQNFGQNHGYTPEHVNEFEHPVDVFVPDEIFPYDSKTFHMFNESDMKSQSRTEEAVTMGKTVDDDTFRTIVKSVNRFDTMSQFYSDPKAPREAIVALRVAGVIGEMDMAKMFDGDKVSAAGREVVESALIGKAFEGNPDALRQLAAYPSMRENVVTALAAMGNNIKLGPLYSLESEFAEAVNLAYQARKNGYKDGEPVSVFARQQNLFPFDSGDTVADYTNVIVLQMADRLNSKTTTDLKNYYLIYNDRALQSAKNQTDLFAGGVKSKLDLFKETIDILQYGTELERKAALAEADKRRIKAAKSDTGGDSVQKDGAVDNGGEGTVGTEVASVEQPAGEVTESREERKQAAAVQQPGGEESVPEGSTVEGSDAGSVAEEVTEPQATEDHGQTERPETDRRDTGDRLRDAVPSGAQRGDSGVDIGSLTEGLAAERSGDRGRSQRADEEAVGHQIIDNAKKSGVFIDRSTLNSFGERVRKPSGESVVYIDDANNRVVKVKDPYAKDNLKGHAASDALYEHIVHNLLFPNTQYRLIGISDDSIGDVRFVLEQDIIKNTTPATQQDIDWYLINELGLKKVEKPYLHYENDYYSITDVDASGDNVFIDGDGAICFIDPIIKFKKPAQEVINFLTTGNAIAAAEAEVDTNPTEGQKEGENQAEEYKAPAKEEGEDVIAYAQRVAETHKAYEEKQRHRQKIDDATARVADAVVSGDREAIEKASAELEKLTQTDDKVEGGKEQRLQEERKQRILSEGTPFDKPFALTPVSETMTPEEIGANVRRIVEGLKASEGDNGDFEGFAYNGNYKKNAGHQVDEYMVSLSGVVPDETLRQWYESEGLKTRADLRAYGEELYSQKSARSQKGVEGRGVGKVTKALRDGLVKLMRSAGLDVVADEKEGQRTLDKFRELARLMGGGEMSERRRKRDEQNRTIDEATAIVTGKKVDDVRRERFESEEQRREKAKEVYKIILSGEYNDVSLQKISDFIEDVTPRNPYGRRLSERLPQRVERALYERTRENAVDALFSRASESAVPANERAGAAGKRAVAEKKKELLEQWAKATGNWHTDLKDFTDNTEAVSDDTTDSDVYLSNDGAHVIKLSRGKQDKRFGTDIDAVPLFNYVFPNSAYRILGYGDFGKGFVRVLEQPYVDFASSTPLTEAERVEYMARLGFKPIGKSTTAFSNGEIVVADLQGNNIVRDAAGNISVIDADCKLHTKDVGGSYKYLPVEHDLPSETLREMRAYHGSGADFDRFDHSHMGEGEGAQAYGWGTYVTEVEGIGKTYAEMMSKDRQSKPMQDKYYEISKNREQYLRKVWEFQHTKDVEERKRIKAEMERLSADNDRLWEEYHELEDKVNSVLYEVEIPDDNGSNYLEWDQPIGEENIGSLLVELEKHLLTNDDYYKEQYKGHENDLIANLESDFKSTDEGRFVYENLAGRLGSDKAASEFLHSMGYVGIKYPAEYMSGGRSDGAKNYVVFDEGDLKITDKARLFRTEEGEVYGFTMGGKIYIDPSVATAETPIHEYKHLWTEALRKANPAAWERLKEVMRQQEGLMDYVRSKYPELTNEDELMEEVFVHYGGRRGAERLESDMREAMAQEPDLTLKAQVALVFHKLREVLQKFWSMARDLFAGKVEGLEGMTAEDFADMALGDLLRGFDPRGAARERTATRQSAKEARDKEYLDSVERSDMETAQQMVNEAAREAMPDTKIVDENGTPRVVYHQTANVFTVFNPRHHGAGTNDNQMPFGVYLKPTDSNIGVQGERQMALFADIKNPLHFADRTALSSWLVENVPGYREAKAEYERIDRDYENRFEALYSADGEKYDDLWERWNNGEISEEEYQRAIDEVDSTQPLLDEWHEAENRQSAMMKNLVDDYMRASEYDGLVIDNDEGSFGRTTSTILALNPAQVKSADAVTYDAEGRVIPLSQRFDKRKADIRYQKGDNVAYMERVTELLLRMASGNEASAAQKMSAYRAIGGNLASLRKAMSLQKEFDKGTVQRVTDLATSLINHGMLDNMKASEVSRLLSAVKNSTAKENIKGGLNTVMDILIDSQLRRAEEMLHKLESVRGSKVDAKGVQVQGQLDIAGQRMVDTFKKARGWQKEAVEEKMANAEERMGSEDTVEAEEAALEFAGLQMALDYIEKIQASEMAEEDLYKSIRDEEKKVYTYSEEPVLDADGNPMLKKDGEPMKRTVRHTKPEFKAPMSEENKRIKQQVKEFVAATEESIRHGKTERLQDYMELIGRLSGSMRESMANARAWKEEQKERVREIQHNANSDMEGRPSNEHHADTETFLKRVNNLAANTIFAPLRTFTEMLRLFGSKSAGGEGYLFNRFVRGLIDARQKEIRGVRGKYAILDAKAREVFGDGVKNWAGVMKEAAKGEKISVDFWDGGKMRPHKLHQGNLMYIYMVDKMSDGRMKLRKMGVSEEAVEAIAKKLDPRLKELADWLQEEFLVDTRKEYNETHKRMFGASMAEVENYFPLKILANARVEKPEDLDAPERNEGISTQTGSIIKRTANTLALDLMGADALHVILDHVAQMEHWNAFAEYNRDLNTLRTYKRFRNQVQNMTTIYGNGEKLWKKFNEVCQIAVGAYHPKQHDFDKGALEFAQGVTAAKVSFRVNTALKQLLSLPAYLPYVNAKGFYRSVANNIKGKETSFQWCLEHLPMFEERWKSKVSGDPRLAKTAMDWQSSRANFVQKVSRAGMLPNAFIDALTVSIGAHAVYETRLNEYLKAGYQREAAEKRAIQDAEIAYNETQQSSEGGFLSTIQSDRTWWSVMFTVFRNSSMAYQRQLHGALRNLGHNLTKAQREATLAFETKQMVRDGVPEERAKSAAKRRRGREMRKNALAVATFGYIVQFAWNLGGKMWYLIFGDDDDEKEEMWDDIWVQSMFGGVEGLTGGDVMSEFGRQIVRGDYNPRSLDKDMPLSSDLALMIQKFVQGKGGEALNDMVNLLVQAGIGVNPQSLTDAVLATVDLCGGDLELSHEALLFATRVLQVPQSQIKKLYFDEIGMSGEDAQKMSVEELVERYARYQVKRGRLVTPWEWDDEELLKKERAKGMTAVRKRMEHMDTEELLNMRYGGKGMKDEVKKAIKKRLENEPPGSDEVNEAYERYETLFKELVAQDKEAREINQKDPETATEMWYEIKNDKKKYNVFSWWSPMDSMYDDMARQLVKSKSTGEYNRDMEKLTEFRTKMVEMLGMDEDDEKAVKMRQDLFNMYFDYMYYYTKSPKNYNAKDLSW